MAQSEGQNQGVRAGGKYRDQASPDQKPYPKEQDKDDEAQDPKSTVRDLKKELQKEQTTLDGLKKSTDRLQTDITELEKLVSGIDPAADEYDKAYQATQEEKGKIQRDYEDMKKSVQATVTKEDSNKVDALKSSILEPINNWNETINTLEGEGEESIASAGANYEETVKNVKAASDTYDKEKNLLKRVNENFKKIKDFKKLADEEDSKGNKKKMYFYFKELEELLTDMTDPKDPWIKAKEEYRADLNTTCSALYNAKGLLKDAEKTLSEKKADLENVKKKLDAANRSLVADILSKIEK